MPFYKTQLGYVYLLWWTESYVIRDPQRHLLGEVRRAGTKWEIVDDAAKRKFATRRAAIEVLQKAAQ